MFALLVFSFQLACNNTDSSKIKPVAMDGSINLTQYNFNHDGMIKLSGMWHFYWNSYITDSETSNADFQNIKVPGNWERVLEKDKKLPRRGFTTYHLKVFLPDQKQPLGLKVPIIFSSSRILINGNPLAETGSPGISRKTTKAGTIPREIYFTPDSDQLDIIIQVANYHDIWGGIKYPLILGTEKQIQNRRDKNIILDIFLISFYSGNQILDHSILV